MSFPGTSSAVTLLNLGLPHRRVVTYLSEELGMDDDDARLAVYQAVLQIEATARPARVPTCHRRATSRSRIAPRAF